MRRKWLLNRGVRGTEQSVGFQTQKRDEFSSVKTCQETKHTFYLRFSFLKRLFYDKPKLISGVQNKL